MNYETFKNELANYEAYKKEVIRLEEELEKIFYQMTGVKGIRYDKEPMSFNPQLSSEMMLDLIEKKELIENEIKRLKMNIKMIENRLSLLSDSDKNMCLKVIAKKEKAEKVGLKYGYSRSGVWARLKREIEKI